MSNKLYSVKKKWYDKELKTLDGEMIVLVNNKAFNIEFDKDNHELIDKFWINENPRLLFKPQSHITSTFAEMFVSVFYNMFGLKTIQPRPAIAVMNNPSGVKAVEGILMEDFVKNRKLEQDVYCAEFVGKSYTRFHSVAEHYTSLFHFARQVEERYKHLYDVEFDSAQIDEGLKLLVMLDYLTHSADRHKRNISYIMKKQTDKIVVELSKIYDNGMSFELVGSNRKKLLNAIKGKNSKEFENLLNKGSSNLFTLTHKDYDYEEKMERDYYEVVNQNLKKSLAKEIFYNKGLNKAFKKILNTGFFDIVEKIKEIVPEFKFNSDDLLLAESIFEFKKFELVNELKLIKSQKMENAKKIKIKDMKNENQPIF